MTMFLLDAGAESTTAGERWAKKWELREVTSDTYPKYIEYRSSCYTSTGRDRVSDSTAALTCRRHEPHAVLVPDLHHAGALGVQISFVTHGGVFTRVVPASLSHTEPAHEIRSKRHLKSILNDVLGGDMLE
jgi:hypothetical protein